MAKKEKEKEDDWGGPVHKFAPTLSTRIGKAQLVDVVSKQTGLTKKLAGKTVDAMIDSVVTGIKRGSVTLPAFGTFSAVKTKARTGVKPGTTTKIKVPEGKRVRFKASGILKKKI